MIKETLFCFSLDANLQQAVSLSL